jgi:hypothetical protein
MSHRALKVTAVIAILLLIAVSGVLGFVLADDPNWFHSGSSSVSVSDEKQEAVAAASEQAEGLCQEGLANPYTEARAGTRACNRRVVGADRLAPHLWRVVLVRYGLPNLCLNVHLDVTTQSAERPFVAAASCP